jgi:hypothetical protein
MCLIDMVLEQTAIISLYSINFLVFVIELVPDRKISI